MLGKETTAPIHQLDDDNGTSPFEIKAAAVRRSNNLVIDSNKSKLEDPKFLSGWEIPPFDAFNKTGMMMSI